MVRLVCRPTRPMKIAAADQEKAVMAAYCPAKKTEVPWPIWTK